jgi:hypothetical protein
MSVRPRLRLDALREVAPRDLLIRFAFGVGISIAAGLVTLAWGARAGGMFLAFPAILPATLTLIAKKKSKQQAEEDDEGALLGSPAMFAFALAGVWGLDRLAPGVALLLALTAWTVVAVGIYAAYAIARQ